MGARQGPVAVTTTDAQLSTTPVIDFAAFAAGAASVNRAAELRALEYACRTSGTFYVRNHGAPEAVLARATRLFDEFFDLPSEVRMSVALRPGETSGYEPLGRDRGEFNDSFNCVGGLELLDASGALPRPNANKWPAEPVGLQTGSEEFMAAMHAVGRHVLAIIAESLDEPPDTFETLIGPANAGSLRARRYPPQRLSPGPAGAQAHTDGLAFSLIVQNEISGLESFTPDRGFVKLTPIPRTIVCQLGSLFARFTNDRYRPNLHRIVNDDPERERRSLVYWFPFRLGTMIRCLPSCESPDNPARYPPVTFERYLMDWIAGLE
jgi:isopenicillin N synthase-like dioxygenase